MRQRLSTLQRGCSTSFGYIDYNNAISIPVIAAPQSALGTIRGNIACIVIVYRYLYSTNIIKEDNHLGKIIIYR